MRLVAYISAIIAAAVLFTGQLHAATHKITPAQLENSGLSLTELLSSYEAGDEVTLGKGLYKGPVFITKALTLKGETGAIIDAQAQGSVIHVQAENVIIEGLVLQNSGISHEDKDSGVFLDRNAHGAHVTKNILRNNLVGVYVWGAQNAQVKENSITGRDDLRMNERGNGVYIWNAPGAYVGFNDIEKGRDGIFVNTSKDNVFEGNRMRQLRYGIHYMHTNTSVVKDNISEGNDAGYALMYSRRLQVIGNISRGDRDHGILLNYANGAKITDNKVVGNGSEKCIFIYNSNKNAFLKNWFEGCQIGVHFTGGSERNEMVDNSFINNRAQVKYVGTRWVEWNNTKRGNYWSDNAPFDVNGDAIADKAYKPNNLVDQIIWKHPSARILLSSPAVRILKWAQGQFPGLYPGGVIDRYPLMTPQIPETGTYWSAAHD